jgi:multidrug transporter EmrE-like cation transporter
MIRTIFFCIIYALLNASGAAMIKMKLKTSPLTNIGDWLAFLFTFQVLVAFIFIFASALVMFKALSSASFSVTIPIATGINFALTIIMGYFIFKDHITVYSFIGFAMILAGIIVLSLSSYNHSH